ncbi:MAG: hypothetical protein ACI9PP_002410 [Halobacteriales archaeon]|jgi:hypothetical protein
MAGIVFFGTEQRDEIVQFYTDVVGAEVWLEQTGCTILQHGNFLFGFCENEDTEDNGVVTFYYDTSDQVDRMYDRLEDRARDEPVENEEYEIYQFFADDPDGRTMEFQTFLHPIDDPCDNPPPKGH